MVGVMLGLLGILIVTGVIISLTDYTEGIANKIAKGVFVIFCGAELLIGVVFCIISCMATDEVQTGKSNLVAIRSDSQIEGSAGGALTFLVANIGEKDVYTFYYETSDGGYKKGTINSSNVTIYETDEVKPSIIKYEKGFAGHSLDSLYFFNDETNSEVDYTNNSGENCNVRYEIFVPEGTIVQNFSLE